VHFDEFLQGMDEFFAQIFWGYRRIRDLAERYNRILIVVAIDRKLRSRRNHTGAMCGQQDEVESIVDLINAVFHGDASHRLSLRYLREEICDYFGLVIEPGVIPQE